jgi:hypothetical protein
VQTNSDENVSNGYCGACRADRGDVQIEQAVRMFAKLGHWSRHAGPAPEMTGCRASPELFARYGLSADGRKLEPWEPETV